MSYISFPDVPDVLGVPAVPRLPSPSAIVGSLTGSISGSVLSVASSTSGLLAGSVLSAPGLIQGTQILSQLTGAAGGVGTYGLNLSQTFSGSMGSLFTPPDTSSGDLLSSDGDVSQSTQQGPQWGIFGSDGSLAVTSDNVVTVEYRQDWNISDYPVEQGSFETYNKVFVPFDVRVRLSSGGSLQNRQGLLDGVAAISGDLNLYDVVTPEEVYSGVNVVHQGVFRSATDGVGLIKVDVFLVQVKEDATETFSSATGSSGTPPIQNASQPSSDSTVSGGTVQASPLSSVQQAAVTAAMNAGADAVGGLF